MIWGAMSSAGVGPLCFLKTNVTAPVYQYILEHFMLPSADQLFKDADLIFQQDLAPAHTAKSTKSWLNDHCAWLASKLTRPETPWRIYGVLSRGKWETRDQKMQMSWRPLSKKHLLPNHLNSSTNWSPPWPRRIEAVIKAKGAPTKYWLNIQYIYKKKNQKANNSQKIIICIGLMKYSNLLR